MNRTEQTDDNGFGLVEVLEVVIYKLHRQARAIEGMCRPVPGYIRRPVSATVNYSNNARCGKP